MFFSRFKQITIPLLAMFFLNACQKNNQDTINPIAKDSINSEKKVELESIKVGILSIDSAASVNERYRPLLNYLGETLNREFELIPLSQKSQFTQVAAENLDFTINNPLAAVQIRRLYDTKFLVTHSRPKTGTLFSGLIVVKQDSEIKTIDDLKGKKVACVNFETAAAGCVFQIFHLKQKGIDPFINFSSFIENKSQDNIVLAVLNNTVDAGFIRTGQLEKMANKGFIDGIDKLRIIDRAKDDFPYAHTTSLYPEWPVAALKNTDSQLVEEVTQALLNIPADIPALNSAKIEGFTPVENYESLDLLIENLKLKSWDKN